ncbi:MULTISPECIES: TetR/AcrR family transcriptional regulator [Amycolatopsis]|uniref:TetR/AcrR family transcriptional regulator n=1 Tax=Amycolatopsis dendrobii TaxID=2760662 RepID=A0A7W3VVB8_9PSEU|nr:MULTISPECIES: TetR/AcrR family transcriptional regulator [Amycolatopsis]MBB1153893.1 TetR/AcrR family transcriptional regulator [Amycolatopsis dendrobii]UKD51659.1 TetR/AcrR family transcriptional regulator [Amycolatopsis sp. FU40]
MASDDQRERILSEAVKLLATAGPSGLSTRAVAAAAGVQTPTLYRLFADKDGLLDAVATFGFESYLAEKRAFEPSADPVDDLRRGWDVHVAFGLANPALYLLMYGNVRPGRQPEAAAENRAILRGMLERANAQGRLRVSVEEAAVAIEASTTGAVLLLLAQPEETRDIEVIRPLGDLVLDALIDQPTPESSPIADRAQALLGIITPTEDADPVTEAGFSVSEAGLLREWLARLKEASASDR